MSREAYQIPTSQGNAPGGGAGGSTNLARTFDLEGNTMNYICGDCGFKFALRRSDTIRCKECGCRILYKERTKRYVRTRRHGEPSRVI
ncbi:metallothionein-I transcription activator [Xylaria sp. FL1777]|nr:metallothionein-I transcription activator [Xylaria sp. FL1777]